MAACRATSEIDAPTISTGRHARGTWTPRVVPGSGGRRYLGEVPAEAEPATVAVAARPVPAAPPERRVGRAPIRYAPVPGAPRRTSASVWGPPRPAGA